MSLNMDLSSASTELVRSSGVKMLIVWIALVVVISTIVLSWGSKMSIAAGVFLGVVALFAIFAWTSARSVVDGFGPLDQVSDSVLEIKKKKTDPMLPAIIQYFSSGAGSYVISEQEFSVFWHPSTKDYQEAYLGPSGALSQWKIDDITCTDRTSRLSFNAVERSQIDAIISDSPNSEDCRVYIDDCVYSANRIALNLKCAVKTTELRELVLEMHSEDIAAQTLVMLRPFFVRVGGNAHQLFRVKYEESSFDSADMEAVVVQVRLEKDARWDGISAATLESPTEMGMHTVICYYLNYLMPRAIFAGDATHVLHSATVVATGATGAAEMSGKLTSLPNSVTKLLGVSVRLQENMEPLATVDIPDGPGRRRSFSAPGGLTATIACYTRDLLLVCAISPKRVVLHRYQNVPQLAYKLSRTLDAFEAAHQALPFTRTAIPNFADAAGRLLPGSVVSNLQTKLSDVANNATDISKALFAVPESPSPISDTLMTFPDQALQPGDKITSGDKRFTLTYEHNGELVLRSGMRMIWSSLTGNISLYRPGSCRLDKSGILSLRDQNGRVYWYSSPKPLTSQMRQPLRLVVTNRGSIEVRDSIDKFAHWIRSESTPHSGYAWFSTCEQASAAYALANAAAISTASMGGQVEMTPWIHWRYHGGRDVMRLHWPGPECE